MIGDVAEQVKLELLDVLQTPDRWGIPILLNLRPAEANAPEMPATALQFSQTGAGLRIQLDVLLASELDPAELRRGILRALLLEMSYRTRPSVAPGEHYEEAPDWLLEGLQALRDDGASVLGSLEGSMGKASSLHDFLRQRLALLDSPSRAVYRAEAAALVRTLLGVGGGALADFIQDLPRASNDPVADLRQHFESLGACDEDVEMNWKGTLERAARESKGALSSFRATSVELERLLQEKIAGGQGNRLSLCLEQAVAVSDMRPDTNASQALAQELMLLASHAHPLLRTVILDYQRAAELVCKGKTHGLRQRLSSARELRARLQARMDEVDDYLNWFEASRAKGPSDSFRDYTRVSEEAQTAPHRADPLSIYLDAMVDQLAE